MTLSEKTEKRHKYLQFVDNMHNKTTMRYKQKKSYTFALSMKKHNFLRMILCVFVGLLKRMQPCGVCVFFLSLFHRAQSMYKSCVI